MLDSLDTTKVLLNNGVKFEEVEFISPYILRPWNEGYEKIIIDGDKVEMVFEDKYLDTNTTNPQCYKHCDHDKDYGIFYYVLRKNMTQMAELMLKSGYKPTIYFGNMFRKPSNNYDDIVPKEQQEKAVNDIRYEEYVRYRSTHYSKLLYLPEYKDMLELILKYDVAEQPSKDLLKYTYERCYRNYIENVFIFNHDVDNDGKYYLKNYDLDSRVYEKYCSKYNKTFDIKEFFAYSSEIRKSYDIFQTLRDKNVQKIFLDKNQTEIIVHPYKEHSLDEIKKIIDEYYRQPIGIKDFDNL